MAYRKLGRDNKHRRSMLATLTKQLIENERIVTTETRAKEVRKTFDKMVTYGKKGTLVSRRLALAFLHNDSKAVDKVFNELAPRYKDRNGGYTRIIKTGFRPGDAADTALSELVEFNELYNPNAEEKKATRRSRRSTAKKETAPVAETSEAKVEETPAAETSTEEKTEE